MANVHIFDLERNRGAPTANTPLSHRNDEEETKRALKPPIKGNRGEAFIIQSKINSSMATTSKRRSTATRSKKPSKVNSYGEKALAYLIVSIVVYGCFIYNPNEDPLQGMTYAERLRAERHAYTNNHDIYDYRNRKDVSAYNRRRSAGSPSYYNSRQGGYAERGASRRYSSSIYRK